MKNVLSPEEMSIFPPEILEEIQRIFKKLCEERGLARGSDGASNLARSILVHYSQGVHDTDTLETLLRADPPESEPPVALH
ncbi:hypothetical protein IB238_06970 [Rhizobium sp. ARZ01]|uniref:hypothetical protein n=1 Tax=Rhizobium sp. ARZ01 TaxID=2769313 RepID=UPI001785D60F|nr:hypothetical protein [Rhizobium sp. ARZ01]MBD9372363.1 hypothetical protein [Rhizobium sp. ARZ01]